MVNDGVDDAIGNIARERESGLVKIIVGNLDKLKTLDFRGFISDLRSQDYDLGILDLDQMERITNTLERYWKETQGVVYDGSSRMAKVLGLPAIVVYEAISKSLGEDKKHLDRLWESFRAINQGTHSPYGNDPKTIVSALNNGPQDSLSILAPVPGTYHGQQIETTTKRDELKHSEYTRIAREFVVAVGDEEKAKSIAALFIARHENFYEKRLMDEFRKLQRCFQVIGDYYNGSEIDALSGAVVDRYLKPNQLSV